LYEEFLDEAPPKINLKIITTEDVTDFMKEGGTGASIGRARKGVVGGVFTIGITGPKFVQDVVVIKSL
jgi:hypothetical protein